MRGDRIKQLTRRARLIASKEKTKPFVIRLIESDHDAVAKKLADEGIDSPVLFEAVCRGYVNNHPAVMAMIDDWIRDRAGSDEIRPRLFKRRKDLDEIYASIEGGEIEP